MFGIVLEPTTPQKQEIHVYHIAIKSDKYNLDEGYVGVTNNFDRRKHEHFDALELNEHKNYKLQEYFNTHQDDVEMYVFKSFPLDCEKLAYQFEEIARPRPNIGLNIAVGGDKERNEIFTAKKYSPTSLTNSKTENFISAFFNGLKTIDLKISTLADEALKKAELKERNSKANMEQWRKEQIQKLNENILAHEKRKRLTLSEQELVDAWKKETK